MKYIVIFITLLLVSSCTKQISKISMAGISINDTKERLAKTKIPTVKIYDNKFSYQTKNKNELLIYFENDSIVCIENQESGDWMETKAVLFDFIFGQTTLKDIRNKFGSYGYKYEHYSFLDLGDIIYKYNYYEFDNCNDEILVLTTSVFPGNPNIDVLDENNSGKLFLRQLSIVQKTKFEKIRGTSKVFDKNYRKIKL